MKDFIAQHIILCFLGGIYYYCGACFYAPIHTTNEQTNNQLDIHIHARRNRRRRVSVGQAGADHKQLVEDIISELVAAVSAKEGIAFQSGTIERLAAYTDVVTDFPCGVKEFEWRNQYFYDLGDDACPLHNG